MAAPKDDRPFLQRMFGGAVEVGLNAAQGATAMVAGKAANERSKRTVDMVLDVVEVVRNATSGLVEVYQKQLRDKDLWPTAAGLAYTTRTVCDAVDVVFNCPPLTLDGMLHEVALRDCLPPLLQTQLQAHLSHPVSEREPRWCAMFRLIHENQVRPRFPTACPFQHSSSALRASDLAH